LGGKFPRKRIGVLDLYYKIRFVFLEIKFRSRYLFSNNKIPHPESIYWINPNKIAYYTDCSELNKLKHSIKGLKERILRQDFKDQVFDHIKDKGKIYGGDWDKSKLRFDSLEVYHAIEMRIKENRHWTETSFFRTIINEIEAGNMKWGCRNKEDFKRRCEYIDRLIESMRENGALLNSQTFIKGDESKGISKYHALSNEITVNIGRNGEYLFQDGRHRLAIAQILKIPLIPVKVLVRHQEWQEKKKSL